MNAGSLPKQRPRRQITERDYQLLRFLWKWKLVSTNAIARRFFPNILPLSAYRRLQYLETDGFIRMIQLCNRRDEVWCLTDKGFKYILPKLGELEQRGYKSEHSYHDFLTTAFHLGEWLTYQPKNSQNYSEQQLRRYPIDAWPAWIPRSDAHRPDGYSAYTASNRQVVAAFEVEVSVKARDRYAGVVAYYDSQTAVDIVYWLVDCRTTLRSIQKSFDAFQVRRRNIHQFILLTDFLNHGWMAPISEGQFQGQTFSNLMLEQPVVLTSNRHPVHDALALLDCRRRPVTTAAYAPLRDDRES